MLYRILAFLALVAPAFGQSLAIMSQNPVTSGNTYYVSAMPPSSLQSPTFTVLKNGTFFFAGTTYGSGASIDTGVQTVHYTGSGTDANGVNFSGLSDVSIQLGSMTPPTTTNGTGTVGSAWTPGNVSTSADNGTGALYYCIGSYTNWQTISTSWTPPAAGTYSLYVGQKADSNHTGNATDPNVGAMEVNGTPYTLTVKSAQAAIAVTASPSLTIYAGQSITFTASGGSGTGGFVWTVAGANYSGNPLTVPFNTIGSYSVTCQRQGDASYWDSGVAQGTVTVVGYSLTVNGGSGSGSYAPGTAVPIAAGTYSGLGFLNWNQSGPGTLLSSNAASTTFTMGAGNATLTAVFSDTQPPTVPPNLRVTGKTDTSISVAWDPATDNVGIYGYQLSVDGTTYAPISAYSATLTGFSPLSTHTIAVRAIDTSSNVSAWSNTLSTATNADTTPPTAPPRVRAGAVSVTALILYWDPAVDDVGVTQYEVFRDGVSLGTTTTTSMPVSGLSPNTSYNFTVRAADAAGNWSAQSTALAITTNNAVVIGLHAAGYGVGTAQTFGLISYEVSSPQTTTVAGTGSGSWTAVHQYRMVAPGIDNHVRITGTSYQRELRFEPPAGYTLFVNGSPYTNTATIDLGNANGATTDSADVYFTLVPNDGSAALDAGYSIDPQLSADDVIWSISLGRSPDGRIYGGLTLRKTNVTGAPISIEALKLTAPSVNGPVAVRADSEFGCPWGSSKRFIFVQDNCWLWLDDHAPGSGSSYFEIKAYDPNSNPVWDNTTSTYSFKNGSTAVAPFARYAVWSNDTNDTITITKNKGNAQEISWTLKKTVSGGTTTWLLQKAGQQSLRLASTVSGSTTTEDVTMEDGAATVYQRYRRTYQWFAWGRKELISESADPNGYNLTTTYNYGTSGPSYGKLLSVTKPDGTYVKYEYATDDAAYGNLYRTYTPWLDVASTAATASTTNAQVVTLTYKPVYGFLADATDTTTTTVPSASGTTTVAETVRNPDFTSITFNGKKVRKEVIQAYYNSTSYLSTTRLTYHPSETTGDYANRLISETGPTGAKVSTIYYQGYFTDSGDSNSTVFKVNANTALNTQWGEYTFNGFSSAVTGSQLVNSFDGQTIDPLYLVPNRSTIELTVIINGIPTHNVRYVFTGATGGIPTFEFLGRDTLTIVTSNGTTTKTKTSHTGAQTSQTFTNGRLITETANDGSTLTYNYDGSGMLLRKDASGVGASGNYAAQGILYTHYTYDGASRRLTEKLSNSAVATDPGPTTSYHYDAGGRLDTETDPTGLVTSISYDLTNHAMTSTLPGNYTKVVTTYADGTLKSITGTAVVGEYQAITVNTDGTITKTGYALRSTDTANPTAAPRWAKSTTDWLGRVTREESPAIGGTVAKVYNYNAKGELTKVQTVDGTSGTSLVADAVTEYNAYEYPYRTGLDLDGTAGLQTNSATDRITETDAIYSKDASNVWWLVKTTSVYNQASNGTAVTTGTSKVRMNQFASAGTNVQADAIALDLYQNQTETKTAVDRTNQLITTTTTVPDSSVPAVSITRNGLLMSSQSSANLVTTYAYDSLRRLVCTSDPRIDGTALAKDLAPRVGYNDGTAAVGARYQKAWTKDTAGYQTSYSYSSTTGRLIATQLPAIANQTAKYTRYDYTARGELYRQWGDTTYPVQYGYSDYGEKTTMTTYRGNDASVWTQTTWPATPPTGDVTTWNYDTATGLLLNKTDAASKHVDYTYSKLGQLKTRTWARAVVTTYKYYGEDAGDPLTGEQKSIDYSNTTASPDLSYTYTRAGQTATVTDATGSRSFAYDPATMAFSSETLPSFLGSRILTAKYDTTGTGTKGRNTGVSLGVTGTLTSDYDVTYGYDGYGRAKTVASGGATFSYDYTPGSNLIADITDSVSGWTQTRTWLSNRDLLDKIETKVGTTSKAYFDYDYDEWGRRTSVIRTGEVFARYVNAGQVDKWGYNDRSEVTSDQTYHSQTLTDTSYPVEGRNYTWSFDNIGNRLQSVVDGRTTSYSSNSLNQITGRTTPSKVDVSGMAPNASTVTANGQAVTRQGDYYHTTLDVANGSTAVNQSVTVQSTTPSAALTRKVFVPLATLGTADQWQYDFDGNLTRDDQWSYSWDAENRLTAIETRADLITAGVIAAADARHLDFTYDYLGRRVEKIVRAGWNGTSFATILSDTRFIHNGWNLIAEYAFSGQPSALSLSRSYTWGLDLSNSMAGAGGVGGLLMAQDGGTQYVYAYDGNGNVQAVVNRGTGTTVAEYEYSAFGETIRASNSYAQTNPFRFSTKYTDNETGLLWYGYRYYSTQTGRFLGRDPAGETGGDNLYAFCINSGVDLFDVLGRDPDYAHYQAWVEKTVGALADPHMRAVLMDQINAGNATMEMARYGGSAGYEGSWGMYHDMEASNAFADTSSFWREVSRSRAISQSQAAASSSGSSAAGSSSKGSAGTAEQKSQPASGGHYDEKTGNWIDGNGKSWTFGTGNKDIQIELDSGGWGSLGSASGNDFAAVSYSTDSGTSGSTGGTYVPITSNSASQSNTVAASPGNTTPAGSTSSNGSSAPSTAKAPNSGGVTALQRAQGIDHITADGTVVMTPFVVSESRRGSNNNPQFGAIVQGFDNLSAPLNFYAVSGEVFANVAVTAISGGLGYTTAGARTLGITAHGATRIAGAAATRGGVLTAEEIATVQRGASQVGWVVQATRNNTTVSIIETAPGRFSGVVEGTNGLVTTFKNFSGSALDRMASNYGWVGWP